MMASTGGGGAVRRWPYATCGIVQMLFLGSMYAWSFFKVTLGDLFPVWSQKQITLNFTIMMCVFCLGGLLAGQLGKKISKQVQVCLAGVLMCIGFLGVSFLPVNHPSAALILLYIFYGVLNGLGTGIAYNAVQSAIQPWFPEHSGLISGVLLMALGFGTLILGNIAAVLINWLGLFVTFRVFAIADLVIFIGLSGFIHMPGGEVPLPDAPARSSREAGKDYTTGEMVRRPTFWVYFCWNVCNAAAGMLIINSASSICVAYGIAAVAGLIISVFNGFGRLLTGAGVDRIGWKATMVVINVTLLLSGVILYLGGRFDAAAAVLIGMLVMGLVYGGGITLSAALIRRLYGDAHYAENFSVCTMVNFPASILGPMLSAALIDGAGGAYGTTFIMVVVLGVVTMILNFFVKRP